MTHESPQQLASVRSFAIEQGVPLRRVKTAIGAGFIPVVKIGSRLKIDLQRLPENYRDYLAGEMVVRHAGLLETYVYFLGPEKGPIKIGIAMEPKTRLSELQTAHWLPLQLHAVVRGALNTEREYHRRFAEHRLHGEWFSPHADILAEIDRLKAAPE